MGLFSANDGAILAEISAEEDDFTELAVHDFKLSLLQDTVHIEVQSTGHVLFCFCTCHEIRVPQETSQKIEGTLRRYDYIVLNYVIRALLNDVKH